jgi:alkylation response protein AidB-like acyl-CoA dehydrogenase
MNLTYTEADTAFRRQVRRWLEANMPRTKLETLDEKRAWHRKLYDAGYRGTGWPEEYGGHPARPMEQAIVAEEMARANAPVGLDGLGIDIYVATLVHHGTERQKRDHVARMLTAEEIWCQLYSEPNSGSDLASLQCRADRDGDEFVINGQKIWTSDAYHADWGILLARTDRSAPKHQGISCIMIDMHQPGIEVRRLKQISGNQEFCEVFFTNVHIVADNLVGETNAGWRIAQTTLSYERSGSTLGHVARLQKMFDRMIAVCRTLTRSGKPAIEDPNVRQKLGEVYAEIEVLRYAALRLLSRAEKGLQPGPEASIAKLHAAELDKRVQELFQDILGPYGQQIGGVPEAFALEAGAEYGEPGSWAYAFLWSRAGTIYGGSAEIQKNILGERVLGLPKEVRQDRIAVAEKARTVD